MKKQKIQQKAISLTEAKPTKGIGQIRYDLFRELQTELDKPIIVPALEGYQTAKDSCFIRALEELQSSIMHGECTTLNQCRENTNFQECTAEDQQILLDIAYAYLSNEGFL